MSRPGVVFSREQLLNAVWGQDRAITDRAVDVYVLRLRQKIETDPADAITDSLGARLRLYVRAAAGGGGVEERGSLSALSTHRRDAETRRITRSKTKARARQDPSAEAAEECAASAVSHSGHSGD